MNENHLSPLPQYHIDRDKLCEIVKETVGYDRLMDAFCHGTVVCDEFAWFSNSDEYYSQKPSKTFVENKMHRGNGRICRTSAANQQTDSWI